MSLNLYLACSLSAHRTIRNMQYSAMLATRHISGGPMSKPTSDIAYGILRNPEILRKCQIMSQNVSCVCGSVSLTWATVSFNHTEEGLYIINFRVVVLSFKAAAKWIIKSGVGGRWLRWGCGLSSVARE